MENCKRGKWAVKHPLQTYKIHSMRTKLASHPNILSEFQELMAFYSTLNDSHNNHISDCQQRLSTVISHLKTSLQHPQQWFQYQKAREDGQTKSSVSFEEKVLRFDEIHNTIAANSLVIEALNQIKSKSKAESEVIDLPIGQSKKELIEYYREINDYYHGRACINGLKSRLSIQDIIKSNPQIGKSNQIKGEIQEMKKDQERIDRVSSVFIEIEEQLLGFKLTNQKSKSLSEIQSRLQQLLSFIKDSNPSKQNEKSTPKTVKECNQIIQMLSLFSNSNVCLMQEKVKELQNKRIKEAFNTIMQNIIKKEKIIEEIYDFLLQNINAKVRILYSRNVRHLSLEKKLGECQKLIKQLRKTNYLLLPNPEISQRQSHVDTVSQDKALREEIQALRLESDQRLLQAQEEIYSLQMNSELLRKMNEEITKSFQQKESIFQAEKNTFRNLILKLQAQYEQIIAKNAILKDRNEQIVTKNAVLQDKIVQHEVNQQIINSKLKQKQQEMEETTVNIQQLVDHLNSLARINETKVNFSTQTTKSHSLFSNLFQHTILPATSPIKTMAEDFNFIEDVPLNFCNPHITGESSPTQSPNTSPSSRKKMLKHSRSLSNVDLYSQLMPQAIEKQYLDNILQGTCESEELKKGIQMRERTIRKYEAFMEKQRQEAKRHRSYILELQSKIRGLQIQQIRLKQLLEDQSSQKQLQNIEEEEECGSMINISDSCQKIQEIGSIQKIAEKEVQLKVKEQRINFKIEEIIQHVLKLNTFKAIPQGPVSACNDDQYIHNAEFAAQGRRLHETQ